MRGRTACWIALLLAGTSQRAPASLDQFVGLWTGTDGITKILIRSAGETLRLHAYGSCHPTDCDWGEVIAYAYGPNVGADLNQTAKAVSASFTTSWSRTLLIVHPEDQDQLRVEVLTVFAEGDKRTPYTHEVRLRRQHGEAETPEADSGVSANEINEDCVSFNPASATVANLVGRWKIVDGSHWLFDFDSNADDAQRALAVIRHYGMNRSCYVGRPRPSLAYLLISRQAPMGAMPGEECESFNPAALAIVRLDESWRIIEGSRMMFDFAGRELEARRALFILRLYGFGQRCVVGRTGAFRYLRR